MFFSAQGTTPSPFRFTTSGTPLRSLLLLESPRSSPEGKGTKRALLAIQDPSKPKPQPTPLCTGASSPSISSESDKLSLPVPTHKCRLCFLIPLEIRHHLWTQARWWSPSLTILTILHHETIGPSLNYACFAPYSKNHKNSSPR